MLNDKYIIICSGDAAAYRCMCTCCIPCREVGRSVDFPARDTTYTHTHDMLLHHWNI